MKLTGWRKKLIWAGGLSLLSLGMYIFSSWRFFKVGFPLDDAWIHQTYARNFSQTLQWSFLPDSSSGGSTGPLWGGLLSLTHWLGFGPQLSGYFWGGLCLAAAALLAMELFKLNFPEYEKFQGWIILLVVSEWHLVWAAGSGMETLLFAAAVLAVFLFISKEGSNPMAAGALTGLAVWIRPGGVTLLAPVVLLILLRERRPWKIIQQLIKVAAGFLILFLPYVLFNYLVAGDVWPNTFYAKQAEYAALRRNPLWRRAWEVGRQIFVGGGILLFPGFIYTVIKAVQRQQGVILAAAAWGWGYVGLYIWRLPVSYQHGRYIIPALPVIYILGAAGVIQLLKFRNTSRMRLILSGAAAGSLILTSLIFWGLGARAYARDVAIIESEMVTTAKWIARNTEEEALIAAHDIGALGYFGQRDILDLAGLVTPDVIPIIREEGELAEYITERGAEYLVTFPSWYPELTKTVLPVYQTDGKYAPAYGGENMVVYRWNR
mgnify:CR=1 FL=1